MTTPVDIPTIDDVRAAHERIKPYIHKTPVLTSETFNKMTGAELFFKCENLQKAGAFKARGASNAVFSLTEEQAAKGVATHSSGNHAASLSYAAGRRGIPCQVVMPETAPQAKQDAVTTYGGKITLCAPSTEARETTLEGIVAETGADFVHPYNDPRIIAGQGTAALELLEEVGELDAIVAPIGGGGMISGSCITCAALAPNTKIYAAEPKNADDAYQSFKTGKLVEYDAPQTVADGLKVPLRDRTFHIVTKHVEDILVVSEEQIIDAMKLVWQRMKVVIEPSSAVTVAAIFAHPEIFKGKRVGVMFTGGNVDMGKLPWMNK